MKNLVAAAVLAAEIAVSGVRLAASESPNPQVRTSEFKNAATKGDGSDGKLGLVRLYIWG